MVKEVEKKKKVVRESEESELEDDLESEDEEIDFDRFQEFVSGKIVEVAPNANKVISGVQDSQINEFGFQRSSKRRNDEDEESNIDYRVSAKKDDERGYLDIRQDEIQQVASSRGKFSNNVDSSRDREDVFRQEIRNPWHRGDIQNNSKNEGTMFQSRKDYVSGSEIEHEHKSGWEVQKKKYEIK